MLIRVNERKQRHLGYLSDMSFHDTKTKTKTNQKRQKFEEKKKRKKNWIDFVNTIN